MGKGDRRTLRGKLYIRSYGKVRTRNGPKKAAPTAPARK